MRCGCANLTSSLLLNTGARVKHIMASGDNTKLTELCSVVRGESPVSLLRDLRDLCSDPWPQCRRGHAVLLTSWRTGEKSAAPRRSDRRSSAVRREGARFV